MIGSKIRSADAKNSIDLAVAAKKRVEVDQHRFACMQRMHVNNI